MLMDFKAAKSFFFIKANIMRKYVDIPKGCRKISVEVENEKIVVSFVSRVNDGEFYCDETGEYEERPKNGDFAIVWNKMGRDRACCLHIDKVMGGVYYGVDGFAYDEAVKFRDHDQYMAVRGIYGEDEL